jgi:hypothetical protein
MTYFAMGQVFIIFVCPGQELEKDWKLFPFLPRPKKELKLLFFASPLYSIYLNFSFNSPSLLHSLYCILAPQEQVLLDE